MLSLASLAACIRVVFHIEFQGVCTKLSNVLHFLANEKNAFILQHCPQQRGVECRGKLCESTSNYSFVIHRH
jgi:hypothetical protein